MKILFFAAALTAVLLPLYKKFLKLIGGEELNYEKKLIPISFGGLILFVELLSLKILGIEYSYYGVLFLLIIVIGTLDDLFGDKSIKGLKGHISAFLNGYITTGITKAFIGVLVALIYALLTADSIQTFLTSFLLIILMINGINLFDLRPGRALKVFFVLFAILALFTPFLIVEKSGFIILGILLIVFFQDVSAKIMIGDSGANLLGLHLGIWYSVYLPFIWQLFVILILMLIHIYAEFKSISKLIDNHWFLKKLDRLGRKEII